MTASITKDAAVDLQFAEGQPATVLIKSTEVAIGVEGPSQRRRRTLRRH